jgi:pimeloyl-ACP methyl ester carboxylesterase
MLFRVLAILFSLLCLAVSGVAEEEAGAFDAHAAYSRLHFQDQEMDFAFAFILGATINHGCEIGEAFATVTRIKEGVGASWQGEWIKTAERVETAGEQSLKSGHKTTAREEFQRACYYYRAALISMLPSDPRFLTIANKSRSLLKRAGLLYNPPLEYFEIPFEGTVLPGYFRAGGKDRTPRKTLLMLGGGETFAEDLVFYIAPQAYERGYNFATIDLPGQGLMPIERKFFRPDTNVPMKAFVDHVVSRPEVDPDRLAAFGISGGGGFVPQAAMHDNRIKAIAMSSCVVDAEPLFATMEQATASAEEIETWSTFKLTTTQVVAWRWGLDLNDFAGLVKANVGFSFDPARVECPALVLVGEGEYRSPEVQRQQKQAMEAFANANKKIVITPANLGAENHCITVNRSLVARELFDWLDDIFEPSKE